MYFSGQSKDINLILLLSIPLCLVLAYVVDRQTQHFSIKGVVLNTLGNKMLCLTVHNICKDINLYIPVPSLLILVVLLCVFRMLLSVLNAAFFKLSVFPPKVSMLYRVRGCF